MQGLRSYNTGCSMWLLLRRALTRPPRGTVGCKSVLEVSGTGRDSPVAGGAGRSLAAGVS